MARKKTSRPAQPRPSARDQRRRRLLLNKPPGSAPGTLLADPDAQLPVIRLIAFGPEGLDERELKNLDEIKSLRQKWPVIWLNIDGLAQISLIEQVGQLFNIHPLALEDVLSLRQRAKVESYPNQLYIVCRQVRFAAENHRGAQAYPGPDDAPEDGKKLEARDGTLPLITEQLSLFLGEKFVITFQERTGDCFDPVRERIRKSSGQFRALGADYLAYAIVDAVIDNYYPVLERYGEQLEAVEDEVILAPTPESVRTIHTLKRDLLSLRRAIWPLREAVYSLHRDPNPLVREETRLYLRDCYDHTVGLIDLLENYRDLGSNLLEVYLSSASQKMNEIMKVLTIIATIFIPLTFIVGVYGMNFEDIPEIRWHYGYVYVWAVMIAITLALVYFFHRKGWLGSLLPPSLLAQDESADKDRA